MADNTTLNVASGGDTIATDDLATINGGAVGSAQKVQRVKVGFGSDGDLRDVDATHGLPIVGVQDARTTGTITTSASTVGPVAVSNRNVVTVDISGTYAGITFVFEGSTDGGTTYSSVQGVNNATGQAGSTWTPAANASMTFDFAVGGFTHVRVRSTAFTSGTGNVGITPQVFAYDPAIAVIPQGFIAPGAAFAGNPVVIGVSDGTNVRTLLGDTAGRLAIGGAAASGASIAGNPVMIGGTFTTTQPTVTTGQAVNLQSTARGELLVALSSGATAVAVKAASTAAAFTDPALTVDPRPGGALVTASAALADATANPTLGRTATHNLVYNGSTWDLQRGMSGNLTTGDTGAKTATGNGATITNVGNKGVTVTINLGTVSGTTPTATFKLQGSNDGGTTWYDIPGATTAAITATGVYAITVYPGAPTVAGTTTSISGTASCGQPLPRTWRVVWTIGGTTPSYTITNIQYNYHPN